MAALEEASGSAGPLSAEQLALWNDISRACTAVRSDLVEKATLNRVELEDPATGANLRMNGAELSAGSPHWYEDCCRGAAVAATLASFAESVEQVCGLRAHDPQTGGWFTPHSVQWFDHGVDGEGLRTYFSPETEQMKALRSTKGDDERRALVNKLVARAEAADVVHVRREADLWLSELATPNAPYEPKRDDLSLRPVRRCIRRTASKWMCCETPRSS